ncbi:GNAT family N-acetyltransferase [Oenococcus sp. UCMA 17063]|nr:GNAT family N-acetyltransferase [Oenococcus sp. UCMA 17063]
MDGFKRKINLTVLSSNLRAKKLYESFGFKKYGIENDSLFNNQRYFDEDLMSLKLTEYQKLKIK